VAMLTEAGYWVHSTQNRNTWWVRQGFVPSSCEDAPALCEGAPEDEAVWRAMDELALRDEKFQQENPGHSARPVRRKRGDSRPPCPASGC
jgi:hypothetical protein